MLYEATRSLWELRRLGRTTPQEWLGQDTPKRIQEFVEQEVSPRDQVAVRTGEDGALMVSRHTRAFPGSTKMIDYEREIFFDEEDGIMYEIARDENGRITERRKGGPLFSDVIDRGRSARGDNFDTLELYGNTFRKNGVGNRVACRGGRHNGHAVGRKS